MAGRKATAAMTTAAVLEGVPVQAVVKRGPGRPRKSAALAAVDRTARAVAPELAPDAVERSPRRAAPVRFPAQVVILTTVEQASLPRAWADKLGQSQADLLREIFEAGLARCCEAWGVEHGSLSRAALKRARDETQTLADRRTARRQMDTAKRRKRPIAPSPDGPHIG